MIDGEIIETIVQVGAVLSALYLGYRKTALRLDQKTEELKTYTDVSMNRMNGTLAAVIHSFDRPCWVKMATTAQDGTIEFRMLELNDHYSQAFGVSRQQYLGKTDLEAGWDQETAKNFREHDLLAWASGEPQDFVEVVDGKPLRFRKLRLTSKDGINKGIMGYAVDCADPANCPVYNKACDCGKNE